MHNIETPHKNKSLSLFYINAYSLYKNFVDLQHLKNKQTKQTNQNKVIDIKKKYADIAECC